MKKIGLMLVIVLVSIFMVTGCGKKEYLTGKINVEIEVENYGTIAVELDADEAPITVTNFVNLVEDG